MTIKITEEIKAKYLANPTICPFCDSKNLEADESSYTETTTYNKVQCEDCKVEWTEVYTVSNIENAELDITEQEKEKPNHVGRI